MSSITAQVSLERSQYRFIAGVSVGVVGLAAVLQLSNPLIFPRFIGRTHPLIAFPLISSLGIGLLSLLLRRGWFTIFKREHLRWGWRCAAAGALFALVTVGLDLKVVFPADLNVAFPAALLFYPAIGFVVEVLFHLLPISVLLVALTAMPRVISPRRALAMASVVVSLLEPVFQTMPIAASDHYPVWAVVFLAVHLTAFNGFQLLIFRRFDLLTMSPPGSGTTWCGISCGGRCGCRCCSDPSSFVSLEQNLIRSPPARAPAGDPSETGLRLLRAVSRA